MLYYIIFIINIVNYSKVYYIFIYKSNIKNNLSYIINCILWIV